MKRELVMLAKVFKDQYVNNWWMSEKLDGMRAWWDGGISMGMPLAAVAYGNKTMLHRYKEMPICSGLWSRYGNPIRPPLSWLSKLPKGIILDGELYLGRGMFEATVSITKAFDSPDWAKVRYLVFDSPPPETIFSPGIIRVNNGGNYFIPAGVSSWAKDQGVISKFTPGATFEERYAAFDSIEENDIVSVVDQAIVTAESLELHMKNVIAKGGEGLILKSPKSQYVTKRSDQMLKLKPFDDSEGTVIGFVSGKLTDKGSKLHGMIGAIRLLWQGREFELSGFTEAERAFATPEGTAWAVANAGTVCPDWIDAKYFPRGSNITFTYRELSADGIPKEARFLRKRGDE